MAKTHQLGIFILWLFDPCRLVWYQRFVFRFPTDTVPKISLKPNPSFVWTTGPGLLKYNGIVSRSNNILIFVWQIMVIIIHQTHYEKSDWSDSLWTWHDKCNICCSHIAFIMSSSTSAWLLSPLECSPQKQNGWTLRFCFWGWIVWKMYSKTIIEFTDNTDLGFDNSSYHAQPHPTIVNYLSF